MNHPIPPSAFATLQFINPSLPTKRLPPNGNTMLMVECRDSYVILTFDSVDDARAWFAAGLALCVDAAPEAAPADDFEVTA